MISAVILTKNEEKNIKACLSSLSWCDECIVIDDHSTDKTVEIAKDLNAKVFSKKLEGNFAAQRNYGLQKASHEWVFFVDADERVPLSLSYEILSSINTPLDAVKAYKVKRVDSMWGKQLKYGDVGNVSFVRLAQKNAGEWKGKVHERWQVRGKVGLLKNNLLHFPHENVAAFLTNVNHYTDVRAKELFEAKKRYPKPAIIYYPIGKFLYDYIIKRGFMDGIAGFVHAMLMSFHSYLVRGKLWQLRENKH